MVENAIAHTMPIDFSPARAAGKELAGDFRVAPRDGYLVAKMEPEFRRSWIFLIVVVGAGFEPVLDRLGSKAGRRGER
jgi:hypothetical protein